MKLRKGRHKSGALFAFDALFHIGYCLTQIRAVLGINSYQTNTTGEIRLAYFGFDVGVQ